MTATIPPLASQYDPFATEAKWQKSWEENQVFKADPDRGGTPYCIVIPPPNVTGSLHMGHAFNNALMDVLVRYHRMQGFNALWLPGTDHASIAVSAILDRELRSQGKTRFDVGRESYLERAWEWKTESGGTILGQLRSLGVSVDWTRERFTLDEGLSEAVVEAFQRLYSEGLIYRGKYLVNWCPASQSAVSDLEVENKEVQGHLWHLRYPLSDGSGFLEVATTRPETMLGDTAVAVHPEDDRYQHLVGKTIRLPIMNREIPIIADESVDASFGTGCVKVTPAHDPNDFETGLRHSLEFINILNKDGTLNENAGDFQGQDRFVARKNVVKRLEEDGFLVKIEDYKHTVPYSDRGKVPIEPLLSTQWFVKIRPLADQALEFLNNQNEPIFVPERWTKVYRDWLVNLKDWCISRQLWWGHQIPAWYAVSETNGAIEDNTPFVVAANESAALAQAKAQFGDSVQLQRDPDVLDTWFSSGLWPFSTMGWPHETKDLEFYYPTSTLVTGFDIIFFWVARMTMMAGHFTGKMPFKHVYIHGLVLDENGEKMSKSKNNGIDPLVLIRKYGTDALRYTLVRAVAGAGQDIRLEYNRKTDESASVEASRNFTNKLWNASRFVMMNLDGKTPDQLGFPDLNDLELSDRWLLSRYHQVIRQTATEIDQFGLGEAAKGLYEFIWGDFCDWYIELVKSRLQDQGAASRKVAQQVLAHVLEGTLRLLHPFMPHITEEVWHTLTQAGENQYLALQAYPTLNESLIQPDLEQQFDLIFDTIRTVRNLRAEADIKPGVKVTTVFQTENDREREILTAAQPYIQDLAKVEQLNILKPERAPIVPAKASTLAAIPKAKPPQAKPERTAGQKYKRAAVNAGLLLAFIVVAKVVYAITSEVNSLPLLPSLLTLVGFGRLLGFAYKNLLFAEKRQNLGNRLQTVKTNVLGQYEAGVDAVDAIVDVEAEATPLALPAAGQTSGQSIVGVVGTMQVSIPLEGVVDVDALRSKLEKDLKKVEAEIASLNQRLSNPKFVDKAPAEVVQATRNALTEAETQAKILRDRLNQL